MCSWMQQTSNQQVWFSAMMHASSVAHAEARIGFRVQMQSYVAEAKEARRGAQPQLSFQAQGLEWVMMWHARAP
jgi:hypothetical protein